MTERLRCTHKTPVLDGQGRPEAGRWIDAGDICLVGQMERNGCFPVVYPTRTGSRRAWVDSIDGFEPGWRIYNQNRYGHIAYPAPGYEKATVRSSGCGVTAMAMAVENLVLGMLDPARCASVALGCGARVSGGTDLQALGRRLCALYPMEMSCGASEETLRQTLDQGGIVVVNTGGSRGSWKGIFSTGGHYIVLLAREGDTYLAADPGLYAGKYDKKWRRDVAVEGELLRCGLDPIVKDSGNRYPPFYYFRRRENL